jgi:hypothetical protein
VVEEVILDFSQALTFQFKDPRWIQKMALAALVTLIPVIGQVIVLGWSFRIARSVITQDGQQFPELDLVEDFIRGLKGWGINLVYSLPAIVCSFPLGIGFVLLIAATDGRSAAVWTLLALCLTGLLVAYSLVLAFVLPAAYGNFIAQDEQFQAGLNFRQVFGLIRRGPVAYFMVFLGGLMCAFITLFGLVGCVIGVVVTGAYATTVMGHLYGQAYREANEAI